MKKIEILDGIRWYLDSKNLAVKKITAFVPPADSFEMRMYHSLYFANMLSALDFLIAQQFGSGFESAIHSALATSDHPNGEQNYGYVRELRNAIVHRGLNINTTGHVIEGRVCALSPSTISNKSGSKVYTAFGKYLCSIIAICEANLAPLIFETLKKRGYLESDVLSFDMNDALFRIGASPDIPDWAKSLAAACLASVDVSVLNEDLSRSTIESVTPKNNAELWAMHRSTQIAG